MTPLSQRIGFAVIAGGAALRPRLPEEPSSPSGLMSVRDDLDLAVDAVDHVERTLVHLALVLGDGAIFPFGQNDAGESADRFLDDDAARRNHRPCGVRQRLAAAVADQLHRDALRAMGE